MFQESGFQVTIRESPDLHLSLSGKELFAEVKHFREKEQDRLDEERLSAATDLFVPYGDTVPLEGKEAWRQVFEVAQNKVTKCGDSSPLIVVLCSSSEHCIEDTEVLTAVHHIDEEISKNSNSELRSLNGILLLSHFYSVREGRSVFFFKVENAARPLSPDVEEALRGVTQWSRPD